MNGYLMNIFHQSWIDIGDLSRKMDIIGYDGYVIGSIHIMGIQWLLDEEMMAIS